MTLTQQSRRARQRLSTALRRLRNEANRTVTELARTTGMSQSKLSKIETDMQLPSVADVQRLLTELSAPETIHAELVELTTRLHIQAEAKRVVLHRGPHRHQKTTARIETLATTSRLFQAFGVPP